MFYGSGFHPVLIGHTLNEDIFLTYLRLTAMKQNSSDKRLESRAKSE